MHEKKIILIWNIIPSAGSNKENEAANLKL